MKARPGGRGVLARLARVPVTRFGSLAMRQLPLPRKKFGVSVLHESLPARSRIQSIVHDRTEEFVFVLRGRALARLGTGTFSLRQGDCLHIAAGVSHAFETQAEGVVALSFFSPALDPKRPDARLADGKDGASRKTTARR